MPDRIISCDFFRVEYTMTFQGSLTDMVRIVAEKSAIDRNKPDDDDLFRLHDSTIAGADCRGTIVHLKPGDVQQQAHRDKDELIEVDLGDGYFPARCFSFLYDHSLGVVVVNSDRRAGTFGDLRTYLEIKSNRYGLNFIPIITCDGLEKARKSRSVTRANLQFALQTVPNQSRELNASAKKSFLNKVCICRSRMLCWGA